MKTHRYLGVLAIALTLLVLAGVQNTAYGAWSMYVIDNAANNGGLIGADGVKFGDFNSDGLPDIVTGWEGGGKSRVYKHPGTGSVTGIWPSVTACATATDVEDAAFMDLDGDGWLDVVSACEGGHNRIYINWGPANATNYMTASYWTGGYVPSSLGQSYWMYVHPMNVDNQNTLDFLACGKTSGYRKICWFQAPTSPRTLANWPMYQLGYCGWGMSMFTVDMDNDGDLDILLSDRDSVVWYEYPGPYGAITSSWTAHILYLNDEGTGTIDGAAMVRTPRTMFLDVGDLDEDGLQDIVCCLWDKDQGTHNYILFLRRLDNSGLNWGKYIYGPYVYNLKGMAIGDVDCDGKVDLVITQEDAYGAEDVGCRLMEYSGTLTTNATWSFSDIAGTLGIKFDQVRLYDLDSDGDLDAVTCEESEEIAGGPANEGIGTFWYRNPTNPGTTYTLTVNYGDGDGKYPSGAVLDIEGDAPPLGQQFIKWTGDTSTIANVNARYTSMTMPSSNTSITATYTGGSLYTLTVNSGSGDGNYSESVQVAIHADAAPQGQMFDRWTGATSYIDDIYSADTTVTMPAANITVTATYETLVTYTLTVNSGSGDGAYPENEVVDIAADAPASGYVFDEWTGNTSYLDNYLNQMTTVDMPAANVTVTGTYQTAPTGSAGAFIEINSLASIEAEHYTSKAPGSGTCAGTDWTLNTTTTGDSGDCMEALPNTGLNALLSTDGARLDYKVYFQNAGTYYVLTRLPGLLGGDNSVSMGMDDSLITANIENTAGDWRWPKALGTLTVSTPGLHTFQVWMREDGVIVDKFVLTSDASYALGTTDLGPSESDRVPVGTLYTLTVTSGSGDGNYAESTVVQISADAPAYGYVFDEWTGDVSYVSNVYNASTSVTMPADDVSVTATYAASSSYTLTVTSGSGDGAYYQGEVVDIVADTPGGGSVFVAWTGDTAYVANVNSFSTKVTMPTANVSVTATYSTSYTLTVTSGSGDGDYAQGTVVNIVAQAAPANQAFDKWTGDTAHVANIYNSSTTVTMPAANVSVTATYKAQAGVKIVEGGVEKAVILKPAACANYVSKAAEEFQLHIAKMTGVTLTIDTVGNEGSHSGMNFVYVGRSATSDAAGIAVTALDYEKYIVRTIGTNVYIVGRDGGADNWTDMNSCSPGSMFAVYHVLGEILGCRWLWPGEVGTYCPTTADVTIPATDYTGGPTLEQRTYRHPRSGAYSAGAYYEWVPIVPTSQTTRDMIIEQEKLWRRRHQIGDRMQAAYYHSEGVWWSLYGATHPEYFATLLPGKTQPYPTAEYAKLHVSGQATQDQKIAKWQSDGTGKYLTCGNSDGRGFCVDTECLAWDDPSQSPEDTCDSSNARLQDRYAKWYKAISEAAQVIRSDVILPCYAYDVYRYAPNSTTIPSNIWIGYINQAPSDCDTDAIAATESDITGWLNAGASKVHIRPNWMYSGHIGPYWPLHRVGNHLAPYLDDAIGFDSDGPCSNAAGYALYYYLIARQLAKPSITVDEAIAEFCEAFGAADTDVDSYIDYWETFINDVADNGDPEVLGWVTCVSAYPGSYTASVFTSAEAYLDDAYDALDPADTWEEARIDFLYAACTHGRKTSLAIGSVDAGTPITSNPTAEGYLRDLLDYRTDNAAGYMFWREYFISREGQGVPGMQDYWSYVLSSDPTGESSSGAFIENGGLVVMEAENYTAKQAGSDTAASHDWQETTSFSGASDSCMQAMPNTGVNVGDDIDGPRMDFKIHFYTTGIYYVHVRTPGQAGGDNSVQVGQNGIARFTNCDNTYGSWKWVTWDGGDNTMYLGISAAGVYNFNIWMREDGTAVDKIVLTTDPDYTLADDSTGPNESPIESGTTYTLTVNSGTGDGLYTEGYEATITADAPDTGYVFDQWTGDTAYVGSVTAATTTFTMPAANSSVTATYKSSASYLLTVNSGTGDGSYTASSVIDISADDPASGYLFDKWTGDTAYVANVNSEDTTVTMPAANVTVTATYTQQTYTLTVTSGSGDGSYAASTVVNISADTAPAGYAFDAWTGDTEYLGNVDASSTTVTMPAASVSVTATYEVSAGGSGAFIETGGEVIMEAENYTSKVAGTSTAAGIEWADTEATGDVGSSMASLPNTGINVGDGSKIGPALNFQINFSTTGVYYQFIRMPALAGADNGINVGMDDTIYTSNVYHTAGDWRFKQAGNTITVSSTGYHTFTIWMREDGSIIDRIYLSTDSGDRPIDVDTGPAESEREEDEPDLYTLTVTSGSGDGDYEESTIVGITADAPGSGQVFVCWTGDTAYVANVNSSTTTVTMPADDVDVTATYKYVYTLMVNYGTGDGTYEESDEVEIVANEPDEGQEFDAWTGDTAYVANVNSSTTDVTMPAANVTVTATYSDILYTLTVNSGTGDGSYAMGTEVEVVADSPGGGLIFKEWAGDTDALEDYTASTTDLTMPAEDVEITATYDTYYTLTVTSGTGDGSYLEDAVVDISADAPQAGYEFDEWTGDVAFVANVNSADTTVTMPDDDVDLTATYSAIPQYSLTVTSGSGDGSYYEDDVVEITAEAPASGYVFSQWTGDVSYLANVYASTTDVTMPAANITVTATYAEEGEDAFIETGGMVVMEAENLTSDAGGSGAAVACTWDEVYTVSGDSGDSMQALPNTGVNVGDGSTIGPRMDYKINFSTTGVYYALVRQPYCLGADNSLNYGIDAGLVGSSLGSSAAEWRWPKGAAGITVSSTGYHTFNIWMREDGMIADKIVLTTNASYALSGTDTGPAESERESAATYTLTVNSGSGDGDYEVDYVAGISADSPATGKQFDEWTGDVAYVTNVNSSSTTVTMPAQNVTVTATYEDIDYTLTVTSGTGDGAYNYQDVVDIYADTPASGYIFNKWTGDTAYVNNIYASHTTVTMPAGNVSVTATYKQVFLLTVNNGSGDGSYEQNDQVQIVADSPAANYHFDEWTGDVAYVANVNSSTTTVTMPAQAVTVTATYEEDPKYTLTVTSGSGDGSYYESQVVGITADAPDTGYVFNGWTGDTAYVANVNMASTNVTMPASNITVTATYEETPSYTLTVNSGTGDGSYAESATPEIVADAPDTGYVFDEWTGDTAYVANVNSSTTTVTMPASNVTVTATYAVSAGAFQEDGGMVVFETEHYTDKQAGTGAGSASYWDVSTGTSGASGGEVMVACPDNNDPRINLNTTEGCRLDFDCNFSTTGVYYIHVRMPALSVLDDTIHAGLNGTKTNHIMTNSSGAWKWVYQDSAGVATTTVTSTGENTFNIWMRENGVRVDKVVLTTNSSYTPTSTGPAESDFE